MVSLGLLCIQHSTNVDDDDDDDDAPDARDERDEGNELLRLPDRVKAERALGTPNGTPRGPVFVRLLPFHAAIRTTQECFLMLLSLRLVIDDILRQVSAMLLETRALVQG